MLIEWYGGLNMIHLIFLSAIFFSLPILNREKKIPFFIMSFILLFFILSIRYDYGNDYSSYMEIFENIKTNNFAWGANDVGFKWLNQISPSFQFLIIIHSFFYMFTMYYLMKKFLNQNNLWIGLVILLVNPYLFLIHLSSLRQTVAMCCFIWAVLFWIDNKKIIPFLLIAVGISFHKSAIILLPIMFLLTMKKNKKVWIQGSFVATLILVATPLFDFVLNFVMKFLPAHYSIVYLSEKSGNSLSSTVLSFVIYIIVLISYDKLEGKELIIGKLMIIGSIISVLTYKISMLTRVQSYFDIFFIVLFPIILNKQDNKLKKIIIFILVLGIYLLRYYSFFTNPLWIEGYSHYKSIFTF